jgi:hypothetical protein
LELDRPLLLPRQKQNKPVLLRSGVFLGFAAPTASSPGSIHGRRRARGGGRSGGRAPRSGG